uniref:Uncharacterized protein n=1 Tax=Glossina brevipalpis TaxID=37001 RepID=A0A1A9X1D4_9MUSC
MHNFRKQHSTDTTDTGVEKNDYPRATSECQINIVMRVYGEKEHTIPYPITTPYLINEFNRVVEMKNGVVFGAIITFLAYFFLMMAFCSPYWIESYEETRSSFKNMGLWQYCFKDYTYPNYQFQRKFTGCHDIFSHVTLIDIRIFRSIIDVRLPPPNIKRASSGLFIEFSIRSITCPNNNSIASFTFKPVQALASMYGN